MGGAMSQNKGKVAERAVAKYLTSQGIPARRWERTGSATVHDEGDLRLDTCPVTIEVKNWSGDLTIGAARTLVDKLKVQKRDGDLGLLVDRLDRVADAGQWRCWLSVVDATRLLGGADGHYREHADGRTAWPVAFRFDTVVALLHANNWVRETVNPFAV